MKVVVLGADSYVGSRFTKWVGNLSFTEVVGWAICRSAGPDYNGAHVYGIENLQSAVYGSDIVVNLHEVQDFSLLPDVDNLQFHNVEIVKKLVFLHNLPGHNWKLVHLSTTLLQCSSRWPNINNCESWLNEIPPARPFAAYCNSKQQAERLLCHSTVDCIIVRPVSVYGLGDKCSVITDMSKLSSALGFVPVISDDDAVMQMMSIDNLITNLWKATEKLVPVSSSADESSESLHCLSESYDEQNVSERVFEIVIASDNTEKGNFYSNFGEFVQTGQRRLTPLRIPFLLVYYSYCFIAIILRLLTIALSSDFIRKLPDPAYLYLNFHHWTFFNNYKAREYLKYTPTHDKDEQQVYRTYYNSLPLSQIPQYSWESTRIPHISQ